MGNASYVLPDGREAGYAVTAACDLPECEETVHRGLDALCGTLPSRPSEEWGCGLYFCGLHQRSGHQCPRPQCGHFNEEQGESCILIENHEGLCCDLDGSRWAPVDEDMAAAR